MSTETTTTGTSQTGQTEQTTQTAQTQQTTQQTTTHQPDPSTPDVESIYRKAQGLAYGNIDATLAELGIEKPAGVKTSDFIKEKFSELLNNKQTQTPQNTNEPNEWELKAKAYQQQLQKVEEERKNIEKSFYQKQAEVMLDTTISSINIPAPPIDDELKDDWIQTQKFAIKSRFSNDFEAKTINGQIVYFDKKSDVPVLNAQGDYAKPTEIIKDRYKSFFVDFGTAKPNGLRVGDTNARSSNKFKTTAEIHEHLKGEKKLTLGTKTYQEEFNKLIKESNIRF